MASALCPHSDCRVELPNRRIDWCACCGTVRPGSVRSQLLGDYAPRLICWHCSTPDQPMIVTPKQIGDHFPLYHKGTLNVPDHCQNPLCQGKNPTLVPAGYGWFGDLLLAIGYWWLPLVALLFIAFLGMPESPNAALDHLAAAPWWHHAPVAQTGNDFFAAIAPAWETFGIWALKAFGLYGMIGLSFWACLGQRAQVTRRVAGRFRQLAITGRVIYLAFGIAFVLSCVLVPIAAFVPAASAALEIPGGFALLCLAAVYVGLLLLLDLTLPLLQLASFSFYGIELERGCRKISQFFDFLYRLFALDSENAPFVQILILGGITLLAKVYGLGLGLLIAVGLTLGAGLSYLLAQLIYYVGGYLLLGLGFLLASPFLLGWEKFQAWRESRPPKQP